MHFTNRKRLLSILLIICFMASLIPISAAAGSSVTFTITPNGAYANANNYNYTGLTITGSGNITGAKVYIAEGYKENDALSYIGGILSGKNITCSLSSTSRVLIFTGTDSIENYQAVLETVTLTNGNGIGGSEKVVFDLSYDSNTLDAYYMPKTEHYYQYVNNNSTITWSSAKDAAAARNLGGRTGYLATPVSADENRFISNVVRPAGTYGWLGGSDDYHYINAATGSNYDSQTFTEGSWYWVTGPDVIPSRELTATYTNFCTAMPPAQPDNLSGIEHYLAYSFDDTWADYSDNDTTITGYFVEYGDMANDSPSDVMSYAVDEIAPYVAPEVLHVVSAGIDTVTSGTSTTVKIVFDRAITDGNEAEKATTVTNYTVTGKGNPNNAVLQNSNKEVLLTYNSAFDPGTYSLAISNLLSYDSTQMNAIGTISGCNVIHYINTPADLTAAATVINALGCAPNEGYQLTCDIDMKDVAWSSISTFSCYFDGAGHVIKNLAMSDKMIDSNSGTIQNLGLYNASFSATETDAAIVMTNTGTIKNCVFAADYAKTVYAVNTNNGTISDCASAFTYAGSDTVANWAFVYSNSNSITQCAAYGYAPALATFTSNFAVTGSGTISNCLAVSDTPSAYDPLTPPANPYFQFAPGRESVNCYFDSQSQPYFGTTAGANAKKTSELTGSAPSGLTDNGWTANDHNGYPIPAGIYRLTSSSVLSLYDLLAAPVTLFGGIMNGNGQTTPFENSGKVYSGFKVATETADQNIIWFSDYPMEFPDYNNATYACFKFPTADTAATLTAASNRFVKKYFINLASDATVTLAFDSTGGTPVPSYGFAVTPQQSTAMPEILTPSMPGFAFAGWYCNDGMPEQPFNVNGFLPTASDTHLSIYALWTADNQTISMTTANDSEFSAYVVPVSDAPISLPVTFDSTGLTGYSITGFTAKISFNNEQFAVDNQQLTNYLDFTDSILGSGILSDTTPTNAGTQTTLTYTFTGSSSGLTDGADRLFIFKPNVSKDALAGSTSITLSDIYVTLSNGTTTVILGSSGKPVTVDPNPCMVYLTRNGYNSGSTLSPAVMNTVLNTASFQGIYTPKLSEPQTGYIINGVQNEEVVVPVASLNGGLSNIGLIEAAINYDKDKLAFIGLTDSMGSLDNMTFGCADSSSAGTLTLVKYGSQSKPIALPSGYALYLKFALKDTFHMTDPLTSSNITVTKFQVHPLEGGVVSDTSEDLAQVPVTQTITYADFEEINSAIISDTNGGTEIVGSKTDSGADTLYAVISADEPNYPVTYSYQWYRGSQDGLTTVAITNATSSTYTPTINDAGYYVWYYVAMMSGETKLVDAYSSTKVHITASQKPDVSVGEISHPAGFKVNSTISYNPSVTFKYGTAQGDKAYHSSVLYTWQYKDNGVWNQIKSGTDESDKSLVIVPAYVNKAIRLTVTASEDFTPLAETQTATTVGYNGMDSDGFLLGAPNITAPTITTASINDINGEKVRDGDILQAAVSAESDPDGIITGHNYQWYRDGVAIDGATGETFTLSKEDAGKNITVKIAPVSSYFNTGTYVESSSSLVYANLNDAPIITAGNASVTDGIYRAGNTIMIPITVETCYSSSVIKDNNTARFTVTSGDSRESAPVDYDSALLTVPLMREGETNRYTGNISYQLQDADVGAGKRYIVFKIMAKENSHIGQESDYIDLATGSTVVIIDTFTGKSIYWSYSLDYTVSGTTEYSGYKVYSILTNLGQIDNLGTITNNNILITSSTFGDNSVFYSPERGKYIVVVSRDDEKKEPEISYFDFSAGITPTVWYGATSSSQENAQRDLSSDDLIKALNIWNGSSTVVGSNAGLIITEVSGNGTINLVDAAQIKSVILDAEGEPPVQTKAGRLGILSK